jgi:lysophospholipase L1-like esterase
MKCLILSALLLPWIFSQASGREPLAFYDAKSAAGSGNFNTGWPGFQRHWQKRQKEFETTREADLKAIVFLGDSITEQAPLAQLFPGLHLANRGISGDTTRGMLHRLGDNVLDLTPKAVVLLCGTNDMMQPGATAEGTAADVKSICEGIHTRSPEITIFVLKIMPNAKIDKATVEEFNAAVDRAVAEMKFVTRVDTYSPYLKPDGSFDSAGFRDGLHPNAAGYETLRKVLAPQLTK